MKDINRKKFIKKLAIGAMAATTAVSCNDKKEKDLKSVNIISKKSYKWKMVTTWPPNFPVLGEGCQLFADKLTQISEGRINIDVYGGGELVPALGAFEAVYSGAAEIGSGASYYWAGRAPSTQFFATVPFGMNAQQVNAWMIGGGGYELWKELYAGFNLVPFLAGNTGVQMGGWFNKEINTIADFKGLKMRMPGLGAKVLERVGSTAVLVSGSELYTSMERGIIDATEWIGPYHDYKQGFHKISKYYYSPGWHEPGTVLELFINKRIFDKLEKSLQEMIKMVSLYVNSWVLAEFESKNNLYLNKLINEEDVVMRTFSPEILSTLKDISKKVIEEICSKDEFSARVYNSYSKFQEGIKNWSRYTEREYHLNF